MNTKRLTATERETLLRLNVCGEILHTAPVTLRERSGMVKYLRRDLALARALINKALDQLLDTIPTEQLLSYRNTLRMSSFTVGARRPGGPHANDSEYGTWDAFEQLNTLLDACHDHCMMCDLSSGERRKCPLKKALDVIPHDCPERPTADCPYFTII